MEENRKADYRFYGRRKGKKLKPSREILLDSFLPKVRLPDVAGQNDLDPASCFSLPVKSFWLEVGFGGGEHLAEQSRRHPEKGFIGAEVFLNGVTSLLTHLTGMERRGDVDENVGLAEGRVDNVRVYDEDVRDILPRFKSGSFERIYVLFPDPWPKRRHADRRFIGPKNLPVLARLLKSGGELRVASDDMNYIRWSLEHLMKSADFEWTAQTADDWRKPPADWVNTRYEMKALAKGKKPVYLIFKRK
ncbi:MAG: tRNA (guanosine(46)-N7)-methyltransferase TrmB [Alphaproteobacteria bacterium]|nr:tRNA (guanosine(46)-N7)-methyltransferase TrmB [Alphaproteobacteria bacterium]